MNTDPTNPAPSGPAQPSTTDINVSDETGYTTIERWLNEGAVIACAYPGSVTIRKDGIYGVKMKFPTPTPPQPAPEGRDMEPGEIIEVGDWIAAHNSEVYVSCTADTPDVGFPVPEPRPRRAKYRTRRPKPAPEASGWRPIESAPRDGTKVMLLTYDPFQERWIAQVDYWRKYMIKGEGWGQLHHPTHWIPLPPAPAADGASK